MGETYEHGLDLKLPSFLFLSTALDAQMGSASCTVAVDEDASGALVLKEEGERRRWVGFTHMEG
jgi:hypothetical protein